MNNTTSPPFGGYNLVQASQQSITYSYSVTMTFIVITNVLNVNVLSRRALRSSPCTYYFLGLVPPLFVYVIVAPLNTILTNTYKISMHSTSIGCKMVSFLIYTTSLLYGLMLVCASIDRFFSSSTSVRLRHLSQVYIARRVIIIVWISTFIYMSPFIAIHNFDYNNNYCTQYSTTIFTDIYLMTRVALYYFLIPFILGIFGILTIYNIQRQKNRVAPVNLTNIHRRTEDQLARMLIVQVAAYFLFSTPSGIIYILMSFMPSMNTPHYVAIRALIGIWQHVGYFMSFFLYILSGKIYREELKKMFKCDKIRDQLTHLSRNNLAALPLKTTTTVYN